MKQNKLYDIDNLIIYRLNKPVYNERKWNKPESYDLTDGIYEIGSYYKNNKVFSVISEKTHKRWDKCEYNDIDKNKEDYYAHDIYPLRYAIEQNFPFIDSKEMKKIGEISVEIDNDIITYDEIKKLYNKLNGISKKNSIDNIEPGNYHFYILLESILNITDNIESNIPSNDKDQIINRIKKLADSYAKFVIDMYDEIKLHPEIEYQQRQNIVSQMVEIEEEIANLNSKYRLLNEYNIQKKKVFKEDE